MSTRPGKTETFTISLPSGLAEEVRQMAARQHRTTSELFRETFRVYREREARPSDDLTAALSRTQALAKRPGAPNPTDDEIEDFIDEMRRERLAAQPAKA
jgi:predicted transcriptional regulator